MGSSYPARFPRAAFEARWKMCSHKNHVGHGFETTGRIGSAWTSHWLYQTHMINVDRASKARATGARAREPERRASIAKPGP
jgi:hypothetical protein